MEPQRASLLGLPVELRLAIFETVLQDSTIYIRHPKNVGKQDAWSPLAYFQVNRQIRRETLPIMYRSVAVAIMPGYGYKFPEWLKCIGPQAMLNVRDISFECWGRCTMYGLQPDTDYCARAASLDLQGGDSPSSNELGHPTLLIQRLMYNIEHLARLCGNSASGCRENTKAEAVREISRLNVKAAGNTIDADLMAEMLTTFYRVLDIDNSASVA